MAGAGGTEVGRVSVRVVPDLDGFRDKVKRELEEIEKMEAEVEVTLNLEKFKAQIEEVKALLKSIQDETVNIKIDKDGGVQKVQDGLKGAASEAEKLGKKLKDGIGDGDTEARVSKFSRVLESFGNFMQRAGQQAGDLAGKMGGELASSARSFGSSLTALITQLTIWVPLLLLAAGGITYLVGIIAAALGGLPVLIFGLGAPIAALILGFDGLKKAFKPLGTEFDKLKTRLSDTFEKGLKPAVKALQGLMPVLSDGLNQAAQATTDFINELAGVITAKDNVDNLKRAFGGVKDFLGELKLGLGQFLSSLLDVAGSTGAFKILGKTISDVLFKFKGFFDQSLQDGSLMKGLENLDGTLSSITGLFSALLRNSLKFFNGAAPGMNKFFDALSHFFLSIDWERLGKAFGTIFDRLGHAISQIPPQTIDSITTSFEDFADAIGDLLDGKSFDVLISSFQLMIDIVTGVIHILDGFLETLANIGDFIAGIPDWFSDLQKKGSDLVAGLKQGAIDKLAEFGAWVVQIKDKVLGWIGDAFSWLIDKGRDIIMGLVNGIGQAALFIQTKFIQIKNSIIAFFVGGVNWLVDKGRDIIMGVVNGIGQGVLFVRMKIQSIKDTVIAAFHGAGSWLTGAGRSIIDGLTGGMQSVIGRVKSMLQGLTASIPSWKGPATTDAKLLFGNGQLIMQSLVKGLNSGYADVKDTLGGMTTEIGNAFTSPTLQGNIAASGQDIAAVGTSQLTVAGQVDSNLGDAVAAALSGWSVVLDETGMARLVNKGNQKLGRRG